LLGSEYFKGTFFLGGEIKGKKFLNLNKGPAGLLTTIFCLLACDVVPSCKGGSLNSFVTPYTGTVS